MDFFIVFLSASEVRTEIWEVWSGYYSGKDNYVQSYKTRTEEESIYLTLLKLPFRRSYFGLLGPWSGSSSNSPYPWLLQVPFCKHISCLFIYYSTLLPLSSSSQVLPYYSSNIRKMSGDTGKMRVAIVGSGNWWELIVRHPFIYELTQRFIIGFRGSAISKIIGANTRKYPTIFEEEVKIYVYEEVVNGRKLTEYINQEHENVKYLPGHKLPTNIVRLISQNVSISAILFICIGCRTWCCCSGGWRWYHCFCFATPIYQDHLLPTNWEDEARCIWALPHQGKLNYYPQKRRISFLWMTKRFLFFFFFDFLCPCRDLTLLKVEELNWFRTLLRASSASRVMF